jgi:hypothetical protein
MVDYEMGRATLIGIAFACALYNGVMSLLGLLMTTNLILTVLPLAIIPAVLIAWKHARAMSAIVLGILVTASLVGSQDITSWHAILRNSQNYTAGYVAAVLLLIVVVGDKVSRRNADGSAPGGKGAYMRSR